MLSRKEGIACLWAIFGVGLCGLTIVMLAYLADAHWHLTKEAVFAFGYMYMMIFGLGIGTALGLKKTRRV